MNKFTAWSNTFLKIASNNLPLTILHIVAILIAVITGNVFLLIVASIVSIASIFMFSNDILQSMVSRLFLATIILLSVYQCEAVIFWSLDLWVSHRVYVVLTYILSLVIMLFAHGKRSSPISTKTKRNKKPIIGLLILLPALLTGSLYLARTIAPQDPVQDTIVKSVNFAMDDASHVSIFADMLQSDGNLLAGDERKKQLSRAAYATYPSGWHASTAVFSNSIIGHNPDRTVGETIQVYYYVKVATLMLLIIALTIFTLIVCAQLKIPYKTLSVYTSLLAVIGFVSFLIIMPMFFDGFFSYLPVMVYALIFAYVSILKKINPLPKYVILLILAAASTITWAITGIVLFLAIVIQAMLDYEKLGRIPKWLYGYTTLFGIIALIPIYILIDGDKAAVSNITAEGGIVSPSHLLLLILIGVFLYLLNYNAKNNIASSLTGIVVAHLLVLAGVLCYLALENPSLGYYYYKIQVIPTLLLLVVACVLLVKFIFSFISIHSLKSMMSPVLVAIVLVLSIPTLFSYEYFQTLVARTTSFPLSDNDISAMNTSVLSKKHADNNERVFFYFPDSAPRSIIGSNTARLSYTASRCDVRIFSAIYTADSNAIGKTLEECAANTPPIIIYTDAEGAANIRSSTKAYLLESQEVILKIQ